MKQVQAILSKEFAEILGNKLLIATVILPLVILPTLPFVMVFAVSYDTEAITPDEVSTFIDLNPDWADLAPEDVFQIVLLQQMMVLFLIMPLIVPMSIAAFSIIGEKRARTLEPLLAAPVSTSAILTGKAIAAGLPGIIATWIAYSITVIGLRFVVSSPAVWNTIAGPVWYLAMGIVVPLLTFFSVGVGIIVSSRVSDTRVAQQLGGVVVIPVIVLSIGQIAGFLLLTITTVLLGAAIMLIVDIITLWVAVVLFERERILTRWSM